MLSWARLSSSKELNRGLLAGDFDGLDLGALWERHESGGVAAGNALIDRADALAATAS